MSQIDALNDERPHRGEAGPFTDDYLEQFEPMEDN